MLSSFSMVKLRSLLCHYVLFYLHCHTLKLLLYVSLCHKSTQYVSLQRQINHDGKVFHIMKVVRLQGVIHIENKLQFLRELRDWKQQDVAKALGVSRSTYANYESGRRAPDLGILMNLADIYGISLDELTGHKVKQSNSPQLTSQALRLLKSFNQLPLHTQEWYIAHMAFDVKEKTYALGMQPATVAEKMDIKK